MALDDFQLNTEEVQVEPFEGEYREGTLYVEAVDVTYEGETHTIDLDQEVEWEQGRIAIIEQMALERLKKRISEEHLVDAEGDDSAEVGNDTKLFKTLQAVATIQPCSTAELGDFLSDENPRSAVGNATYRGFMQAVAENGQQHYYVLTAKGWKQLISHLGVDLGQKPDEETADAVEEVRETVKGEDESESEEESPKSSLEDYGVEEEEVDEPTDQ